MNAVIDATTSADVREPHLRERLSAFVAAGSTEVTTHDEGDLDAFARLIPAGYTVYVAHTPKASLEDVARVALRLKDLGLAPSPHIVARRVTDPLALRRVLDRLAGAGIGQILLVAGDRAEPGNRFNSTAELLESGVVTDAGIQRVGVAGHPEGHPAVADEVLWQALQRKQSFAARHGLHMHIATQFGFDTRALAHWEQGLKAHDICLPVHAGVAGPTPFLKLLKYAAHCGVGASLKAVSGNPLSFSKLPHFVTKADEMLIGVYRAKQGTVDSRIFAPHFFAFGGVLATARWLRAVVEGSFELNASESGFSTTT